VSDVTGAEEVSSIVSVQLYMLKLHGLSLLLQLALTAPALASLTSVNESRAEQLRIAFAPHPFLSHWAVSAPIAHELLQRGHKALVSHTLPIGFGASPCILL